MVDDVCNNWQPATMDNLSTQVQAEALVLPQQPSSLPSRPGLVGGFDGKRDANGLASTKMGWLSAQFVLISALWSPVLHIDPVFINEMMAKTAKRLNDKISKHGNMFY